MPRGKDPVARLTHARSIRPPCPCPLHPPRVRRSASPMPAPSVPRASARLAHARSIRPACASARLACARSIHPACIRPPLPRETAPPIPCFLPPVPLCDPCKRPWDFPPPALLPARVAQVYRTCILPLPYVVRGPRTGTKRKKFLVYIFFSGLAIAIKIPYNNTIVVQSGG